MEGPAQGPAGEAGRAGRASSLWLGLISQLDVGLGLPMAGAQVEGGS